MDNSVDKADLERVDRTIEQIRDRMESNFDIINRLLREVSVSLSNISAICPLQKEELKALKETQEQLDERVTNLEKVHAEVRGITKTAKFVWGIVSAIIGFLAAELSRILSGG